MRIRRYGQDSNVERLSVSLDKDTLPRRRRGMHPRSQFIRLHLPLQGRLRSLPPLRGCVRRGSGEDSFSG